jgi:hypothetical protein
MDSVGVESTGLELDERARHRLIRNESVFVTKCTADLVMSLESGSRTAERYADELVQCTAQTIAPGGTLVWTSANTNQKGGHNINCQPTAYWIEKFERCGLVRNELLERGIKAEILQGYHMGWFIQNLVVFKKTTC